MTAAPETPRPNPEFVTAHEAARALRVSPMTIYRLIDRKEISAVRVGRLLRIPYTALDQFVRDAEVGFDWHIG